MKLATGEARPTDNPGPRCRQCRQTEARCAWLGSCCLSCSHFRWLDNDGNEHTRPVVVPILRNNQPTCPTCLRSVTERGRFDCPGVCAEKRRSYDRDLKRLRYRQRRAS